MPANPKIVSTHKAIVIEKKVEITVTNIIGTNMMGNTIRKLLKVVP